MDKEEKQGLMIVGLSYLAMLALPVIFEESFSKSEIVSTSRGPARVYNWSTSKGIEVFQGGIAGSSSIIDYNRDGIADVNYHMIFFPKRGNYTTSKLPTEDDQNFYTEAISKASPKTLEHLSKK